MLLLLLKQIQFLILVLATLAKLWLFIGEKNMKIFKDMKYNMIQKKLHCIPFKSSPCIIKCILLSLH